MKFKKFAFVSLISISALQEFFKWIYSDTVDGIIFLDQQSRVQHQILNILNLQEVSFRVFGDGYHKINCNIENKYRAYNIFLHVDAKHDDVNNFYDLNICSNVSYDNQLDNILNIASYESLILSDIPKCIEIFGSNSKILSDSFAQKLSNGMIINHFAGHDGFIHSIMSILFLQSLSPHTIDPFYRFARNILENPYSSSIAHIKDNVVQVFKTNTQDVILCTKEDVQNFYNSTINEFIKFYRLLDYQSYSSKFGSDIFLASNDFPNWYNKLQEKNIDHFRELLLLTNIARSNYQYVECLVDNGVNINSITTANQLTPMRVAVTLGNANMTEFCITHGADINYQTSVKMSYLMIAAYHNYADIIRLLVANNISINTQDQSGMTALHYASLKSNNEILKILLSNGADASIINNKQQSAFAIAYAAKNGDILLEFINNFRHHINKESNIEPQSLSDYCFVSSSEFAGCIAQNIQYEKLFHNDKSLSYLVGIFFEHNCYDIS